MVLKYEHIQISGAEVLQNLIFSQLENAGVMEALIVLLMHRPSEDESVSLASLEDPLVKRRQLFLTCMEVLLLTKPLTKPLLVTKPLRRQLFLSCMEVS